MREAEERVAQLERESGGWRRSRGFVHAAEVIEVRLTDQLLMLDTMLNDCVTAAGRTAVKAVVTQLRALGTRILAAKGQS